MHFISMHNIISKRIKQCLLLKFYFEMFINIQYNNGIQITNNAILRIKPSSIYIPWSYKCISN